MSCLNISDVFRQDRPDNSIFVQWMEINKHGMLGMICGVAHIAETLALQLLPSSIRGTYGADTLPNESFSFIKRIFPHSTLALHLTIAGKATTTGINTLREAAANMVLLQFLENGAKDWRKRNREGAPTGFTITRSLQQLTFRFSQRPRKPRVRKPTDKETKVQKAIESMRNGLSEESE